MAPKSVKATSKPAGKVATKKKAPKALATALGRAKKADAAAPKAEESLPKVIRSTLHYKQIKDRPHGDTRTLNAAHVQELADSIVELEELIQPIAVDELGCLVAGGHRRAAIHQIFESTEAKVIAARDRIFPGGQVPVKVLAVDAAQDNERALLLEAAENEKRKQYSTKEVEAIVSKLEAAGYTRTQGRPQKGQKSLAQGLQKILKRSRPQVQRYLKALETEPVAEPNLEEKQTAELAKLAKSIMRTANDGELFEDPETALKIVRAASNLINLMPAKDTRKLLQATLKKQTAELKAELAADDTTAG